MRFTVEMTFLGNQSKVSKKTDKPYYLTKLMYGNEDSQDIYEMYVSSDRLNLVTTIYKLRMFQQVTCTIELSSFNGKMQTDLVAVEPLKEGK